MELKFRVWDNKRKMFVPNSFVIFSFHDGFKITISPDCLDYIGDECHNYFDKDRFIVSQYTGWFDRNRREIYTDDIVYIWYSNAEKLITKKVEFTDGRFNIINPITYCRDGEELVDYPHDYEVLGNSFEYEIECIQLHKYCN